MQYSYGSGGGKELVRREGGRSAPPLAAEVRREDIDMPLARRVLSGMGMPSSMLPSSEEMDPSSPSAPSLGAVILKYMYGEVCLSRPKILY